MNTEDALVVPALLVAVSVLLVASHDPDASVPRLSFDESAKAATDRSRTRGKGPVDVVYTWVNSSDAAWRDLRDRYASEPCDPKRYPPEKFCDLELALSLRLTLAHMPWVRTVHVLTMGQTPPCLVSHPDLRAARAAGRIRVASHRDVLPETALPVFNSHAIESGLHKIPDLAERFIYMNDDVFVIRPVEEHHFYGLRGGTAPFLRHDEAATTLLRGATATLDPHTASSLLTTFCRGQVGPSYHAFNELAWHSVSLVVPSHTPHALTRTIMRRAEHHFRRIWRSTSHARFRTSPRQIPPVAAAYGLAVDDGSVVVEARPLSSVLCAKYLGSGVRDATLEAWERDPDSRPYFACFNDLSEEDVVALTERVGGMIFRIAPTTTIT